MKSIYDVIIRPIITEKASGLVENLQYTFEVARTANKSEIKEAVEKIFNVNVVEVRTINVHRKAKRMQRYPRFLPDHRRTFVERP